ncbi:unnamed protein product [Adineta steineri]|uniref:Uncharacterized protein n=1 Tax=Adineta steineri TaxID=433720 RepID=A0A813NYN3_9BILA|nr:unnamed protein product [Adineta steineri]CAF3632158.1 unnamed protein product [Adineta steineri]
MKRNRRFPFERTDEKISLEDFSTAEQQLYPIIRQYASICRHTNNVKTRYIQQNIVDNSNNENSQLNEFMNYIKQERDNNNVDINNFSTLREHNIQHWKHIKSEWQKYYQNEIKKHQEIFSNLIKTS